jgi:type VI secretion system protein ImpK
MAMTAETQLKTTKTYLSGLSYPKELGYYRSKVYTFYQQDNPLVSAAQPIFSCIERIKLYKEPPQLASLQESLSHELKAFQSKASLNDYSQEYITISSYLLTSTIDELLAKSYQKDASKQVSFKAFTPVSNDNLGPEQRFFDILELILDSPNQYLDLIELAYLCFNTGFEGKYHFHANGKQQLDDIIDRLFQILEQYKSCKKHQFFTNEEVIPRVYKSSKLWLIITSASTILVLTSFILSQFNINKKASSLINNHLSGQVVNYGS